MSKMDAATRFFFDYAGYSYGPGETPAQGRRRCAEALADAERHGRAMGWYAEWMDDPDHGHEDCDHEHLACVLRDRRGAVLASLGSVCGAERNEYARVVEAELALEAKDMIETETMEAI